MDEQNKTRRTPRFREEPKPEPTLRHVYRKQRAVQVPPAVNEEPAAAPVPPAGEAPIQEVPTRRALRRSRVRQQCNRTLFRAAQGKITLFAALMLTVFLLGLIIPLRPTVSELEKRELTKFPAITWETFWSGEFFKGVETWYADTFPFREQLLSAHQGVTALYGINDNQFIGDQIQNDEIPDFNPTTSDYISPTSSAESSASQESADASTVTSAESSDVSSEVSSEVSSSESSASSESTSSLPVTSVPLEDQELQSPEQINSVYLMGDTAFGLYGFSQSASLNYCSIINTAAEKLSGKAQVYSVIAPISYSVYLNEATQNNLGLPNCGDAIQFMYANMDSSIKPVSVYGNIAAHADEYLYFRTDHHWTALGAYRAYEVFCNVKGIAPHPLSYYETVTFDGFLGSLYSACNSPAALYNNPDTVIAYKPVGADTLHALGVDGEEFDWPIINDVSDWGAGLKYNAFSAADQAFETIHNETITDGSAVLVVQDSFGNAFVPFLVDHYEYVYVADPRHYNAGLVDTVTTYGVQDVIFVHNVSTTGSEYLSDFVAGYVNR